MDISTIGSISNVTADAVGNNSLGKQDFLNLLLEQLSHQDPLNPMDSTEFTTQLSQFSSLEELSNINSTLNEVLVFQQSMQNASVSNLVGKTVKVNGNSTYLTETSEIDYELTDEASSVEISIYDSTGNLVRLENVGAQTAGDQSYSWDGYDDSGNKLPEGSYSFEVEAQDVSGEQVQVSTSSSGTVTEVIFENGLTYIVLDGDTKVYLSDIKSIG